MTKTNTQASLIKRIALTTLAGTVLATGLTVGAMANDDRDGARDRDRSGASFRAGERFARADLDGDRMISLDEFQAGATQRFSALDIDADGLVTPAEMAAARQRASEDRAARMIERLDTDGDGSLSQSEMETASAARFARMDRDDDGNLEPREMRRGDRRGPGGDDSRRPARGSDDGVVEQSL